MASLPRPKHDRTVHPRLINREFQEAIRDVIASAGLDDLAEVRGSAVVGITSPSFGEGKTTLAMALAGLLSTDLDADVALIDVDFETHSLGIEYDLDDRSGLADVLSGRASLESVTTRVAGTRLDVVGAGTLPSDFGRMVRSGELTELITMLRKKYPYVVLDLPGMLTSSAGRMVAPHCDGVIVVTESGKTARRDLDQTLERLEGVRVLGVVVNRWKSNVPRWLERALGLVR